MAFKRLKKIVPPPPIYSMDQRVTEHLVSKILLICLPLKKGRLISL